MLTNMPCPVRSLVNRVPSLLRNDRPAQRRGRSGSRWVTTGMSPRLPRTQSTDPSAERFTPVGTGPVLHGLAGELGFAADGNLVDLTPRLAGLGFDVHVAGIVGRGAPRRPAGERRSVRPTVPGSSSWVARRVGLAGRDGRKAGFGRRFRTGDGCARYAGLTARDQRARCE